MRIRFSTFVFALICILSIMSAMAQDACPALVEQALAAVGDNCDALDRNSACYGYNQVEASFAEDVGPDYFTRPSDRAGLTYLSTIRTAPLDLENDRWGVAVLSVQANVPNTLPGQAVTFLLMGDAELTNQVDPEAAFEPSDGISVTASAAGELFSSAGGPAVLAGLEEGQALMADLLSADELWVRVTTEDLLVGWAAVEGISGELDLLPRQSEQNLTPMQAFYFTTGLGQPLCNEAQSAIAVQSPDNLTVNLTVNGAEIGVGSTIVLQRVAEDKFIITVQEGSVVLEDGTVVPAGFTVEVTVDEEGNVTGWGEPRPATPEELELASLAARGMAAAGVLIELEDEPGDEIIHIVQPGETLFGIAQLYDASMPAIVARNGLTNPRLLTVGQQLIIPNPGSGFASLPTTLPVGPPAGGDTPGSSGPSSVAGVNCALFRATAPLDGMSAGLQTFYWDAAPGATGYRLRIFNNQNVQVFEGTTTETNMTVDTSADELGGFQDQPYSWTVEALAGSATACGTQPVVTQREWPYAPPLPNFAASRECLTYDQAYVTWSGAQATSTIYIWTYHAGEGFILSTPSGSSGTTAVYGDDGLEIVEIVVREGLQGDTIMLAGCQDLLPP